MTRLTDVDICIEKIKQLPITYDSETVQRCIEVLSNAPIVDAIPIEFIQKRIDQLKEMNGRIFIANGGYTSPSDYEQWELERLIRDWREQNDEIH